MGFNLKIIAFILVSLWTLWFEQAHGGLCDVGISPFGYKCQEFDVTTEDGYILSVQRITEGRKSNAPGRNKPPVLLQHGLMVDGMSWLLNSPEQNLPMILADNGFDVWISNSRGTKYSQRHKTLNTMMPNYWDWSWYELGKYDLPAVFNFISGETSQKIRYIGHSQGTLIAITALSEGRLADQIHSAVLLTPIAYLGHISSVNGATASKLFAAEYAKVLNPMPFDPTGNKGLEVMGDMSGPNCCVKSSTFMAFARYEPQPTSNKNLQHYAQLTTGVFAQFDYTINNMLKYGQPRPPVFDVTKIPTDLPMFLLHGGHDALSVVEDVKILVNNMKNHDKDLLFVQFYPNYAHLDFIMASNANELIYKPIMQFYDYHG